MKQHIGVVGLGSMGFGIAQSVLRAGHKTSGADVVDAAVQRLIDEGADALPLAQAITDIDALLVVVLNAAQTEDVLFGADGLVARMKSSSVVVACATVPPEKAREFESRCLEHHVHYLDAPISGGAVKASQGQLSIMAAGTKDAFSVAEPALNAISQQVFKLGESAGAGSAMKAVNQLLAGVHIASMAEAITFGMAQGIKPQQFLDVISQCAGTSWMLENRAPHVVSGDYTPHSAVNIWLKDLGIVKDIANTIDFPTPLTEAALKQFSQASESGLGHEDDAAVAKVYAREAGISLPGEDNT